MTHDKCKWGACIGELGAGPHPPAPQAALLALRAGPPPGWPSEELSKLALLQLAIRLRWLPGQDHLTYVELAVDLEAHAEQALPATFGYGGSSCRCALGARR